MAFLRSATYRTMPVGGQIMLLLLLLVQGRIVPSAKRRSLSRFMVNPSFYCNIVMGATIFYLSSGVVSVLRLHEELLTLMYHVCPYATDG